MKKYATSKKSEADFKDNISKARSKVFFVQEVKISISYLEEVFRKDTSIPNDDEIKSRKDDMSEHLQQLENLPKKMQNLLGCGNSVQIQIHESAKREISKTELFNKSKLKINLSKFSGII